MLTGVKCKMTVTLYSRAKARRALFGLDADRERQDTLTIPSSDNTIPFSSMEIKPQKEEM